MTTERETNPRDPNAAVLPLPVAAGPVHDAASLDALIERTAEAQRRYATFDQAAVDEVFRRAALAINDNRIRLARLAAEETGMGIAEDKVIKNHFASEYIYNKYKSVQTVGVIEEDAALGIRKIAEPLGVLAGVVPCTNPTSTAAFKALIALKTRNAIIFSPHPKARRSTIEAARIVAQAAVEAGAPEGLIGWIDEPTIALSQQLMAHPKIALILATGGPGMVKAAYSSGKPAVGVGAGNTPAVIDETADVRTAVSSVLLSKSFDNGMICASEQSVVVVDAVYEQVKAEFVARGAYLAEGRERELLRKTLVIDHKLNARIVGQPAWRIAQMAGFEVPKSARILVAEADEIGAEEPLSYEKLSPVLAMYRAKDFEDALAKAVALVRFAGMGHTSVLHTAPSNVERIARYGSTLETGRVLVNQPAAQGAIGDIYNFALTPSLTLGCGSWGGNSVSENVGIKQLLNVKTVTERRENMLWFRVPSKVFFKRGCLPVALTELAGKKRAFVVTDRPLYELGIAERVTTELKKNGMATEVFYEVNPDPDLATARKGLERMRAFNPDVIVAVGGGSPMDAAKIMWLMYEHPEARFEDLAMRFMDIRKRIYTFPKLGVKAILVAIPTTSGTGSEVTPFAVITDEKTGRKYPIADYELTPTMAICDADLAMGMPKRLTAYSGIDALTHALEAFVAVTSTDYTDGLALEAARLLFEYLPAAYRNGQDGKAREKVHNASTMAGMAFANAFLGLCHSMAHKLGGMHHVPHGLANALLINEVIRYNSDDAPRKQAAFPQYEYPQAKARYARVARYLGLRGETDDQLVEALIGAIDDLKHQIGIPMTIKEAGVEEKAFRDRLEEMVELAFDDQCTGANPRYPLFEEIRQLYLDAYYGRARQQAAEPANEEKAAA
jgi:acetaldehyde dehydrogenase/alcohol dehydrogenase